MNTRISVLFLLTNLIFLDLNLAQESGDGEATVAGVTSTYSDFPLGDLFGLGKSRNLTKNTLEEILSFESDDDDINGIKSRAVYWIPTVCDSLAERGYTCYSCSESLHCMGNNFGLKAFCGSRRPFCNNGVCSDLRGEKCTKVHEIDSVQEGGGVHDEGDVHEGGGIHEGVSVHDEGDVLEGESVQEGHNVHGESNVVN